MTTTLSVIVAPGCVCWELIWVFTFGVAVTTVVSATSAHSVFTARTKSPSSIDSRYV